ncbi:MAG: MarR family winged helix-turn-helix transcriptional regulator [Mycetocola sp.]
MSEGSREIPLALRHLVFETQKHVSRLATQNQMHPTDLNAISAILGATAREEAPTPSTLSRELNLSAPATTAVINRLVSNGHAERHRHDGDGRRVTLSTTPTANAVGRTLFMPLATQISTIADSYSDDERAIILRFLRQASSAVSDLNTDATSAD